MELREAYNSSSSLSPSAETSLTEPSDDLLHLALPSPPPRQTHFYGLCLIVIPTVTILGNLLVIVSVLRFKALHSAINFLILGLAVADLLVALFVMPYAVYIYVEGGYWFLGPLMCDIYSASDVACSTASILLLSVISFDRYRAVSRPIQYSRQSQNVQRVIFILIAIWLISLIVASPIVLGVNNRPLDAHPYECRFYNPDFSIGSSIISFVIPCFIILFVYVRIIIALRAREKAARLRRLSHQNAKINQSSKKQLNESGENTDEAARIVAGPDEQDVAGTGSAHSSSDSLCNTASMAINDIALDGGTTISRRTSDDPDSSFAEHTISSLTSTGDIVSFDPKYRTTRETQKRRFSRFARNPHRSFKRQQNERGVQHATTANGQQQKSDNIFPTILRHLSRRSPKLFRSVTSDAARSSPQHNASEASVPVIENNCTDEFDDDKIFDMVVNDEPDSQQEPDPPATSQADIEMVSASAPLSAHTSYTTSVPCPCSQAIISRMPLFEINEDAKETGATTILVPNANFIDFCNTHIINEQDHSESPSERPAAVTGTRNADGIRSNDMDNHKMDKSDAILNEECIIQNPHAIDPSTVETNVLAESTDDTCTQAPPAVTFDENVKDVRIGDSHTSTAPVAHDNEKQAEKEQFPLLQSAVVNSNLLQNSSSTEVVPILSSKEVSSGSTIPKDSGTTVSSNEHNISNEKPSNTFQSSKMKNFASSIGTSRTNTPGGFAVRIVKRKMIPKESSLKRKVSKSQRKEKRATKTLGVVVGIFLICWVPFFSMNILNAICIKIGNDICQIGFGPFFYSTWIGYMNSFMNPIIYTIFNTEFRRAFKSILLGRKTSRRQPRAAANFKKNVRRHVNV